MAEEKIVVIGAGPCGLGAGYRLNEAGYQNWVMLEAAERGGGLAKSVIDSNGFLYDLGVHQIYSHYEYFDNVMDTVLEDDKWFTYIRDATVRMRQRYVPYPFQYNVRYLDESEVMECLAGLLDVHEKRSTYEKPTNFKEWIYQSFGAGLAKIFLIPYNYKTWAITSDKMACGWMGERVATVNLKRLLENIVYRKDDIGWGPNATFKYPKRDGSGAVWDAVLHSLPESKVRFNAQIKSIHTASKTLTLTNGEKIQYDKLLSTLPADILLRMLEDRPEWHALADKYYHSSVHLFGLGIEGVQPSELKGKFWIYVPEEEYIFHRVTVMSNYSIYNVPKVGKQWSLLIEVSESKDRQHPQFKTVEELKEEVIEGLVKVGLLPDRKEIVSEWYHRLDYAYPTPFLNRDEILHDVQDKLLSVGIRSRGRFGGWKYEVSNQDHSFMQGVEAADSMLYNTPEVTYFTPAVIEGGSKIGKRPSPQELALNKK